MASAIPSARNQQGKLHRVRGHIYGLSSSDEQSVRFIIESVLKQNIELAQELNPRKRKRDEEDAFDEDEESLDEDIVDESNMFSPGDHDLTKLTEINIENRDFVFSLPTTSPFVRFTLVVRRKAASQVYQVMIVEKAERRMRNISKKELVRYYLEGKRYPNEKDLRKKLSSLPIKDITVDDVYGSEELKTKHVYMASELIALLKPLTIDDYYFTLLRFFSSVVLLKLKSSQRKFLVQLLVTSPHIFCFRTLMEKALEHPDSPFSDDENSLQAMKVDLKYSLTRTNKEDSSFRESMVYKSITEPLPVIYHPRYPLVPYHSIRRLVVEDNGVNYDMKNDPLIQYILDPELFATALDQCLKLESLRHWTGTFGVRLDNSISINNGLPLRVPAISTVDLLMKLKITVPVVDVNKTFMLEDDDHLERVLAQTVVEFCRGHVSTYEATWYNRSYCRQLNRFIMEHPDLRSCCFFYTHSFEWKKFLVKYSNISFESFKRRNITLADIMKREQQLAKRRQACTVIKPSIKHVIVVDHAQKFGAQDLLCLIWGVIDHLVVEKGASIADLIIQLVLIGNDEDLPVYNLISKGEIWKAFCHNWPAQPLKFQPDVSMAVRNLRDSLNRQYVTNVPITVDRSIINVASSILEKTRELSRDQRNDKQPTTPSKPSTSNTTSSSALFKTPSPRSRIAKATSENKYSIKILCSSKNDQKTLSGYLDKSNITNSYDENVFYLNNDVGVLETGSKGIIKKRYLVNADGSQTEIQRKDKAELHFGSYVFEICPCPLSSLCKCNIRYSTSKYTIYHDYVDMVQRDQGIPTDYVIFYASSATTLNHIQAAAVNCTKQLFVFMLDNVPFAKLYEKDQYGNVKSGVKRLSNLRYHLAECRKNF